MQTMWMPTRQVLCDCYKYRPVFTSKYLLSGSMNLSWQIWKHLLWWYSLKDLLQLTPPGWLFLDLFRGDVRQGWLRNRGRVTKECRWIDRTVTSVGCDRACITDIIIMDHWKKCNHRCLLTQATAAGLQITLVTWRLSTGLKMWLKWYGASNTGHGFESQGAYEVMNTYKPFMYDFLLQNTRYSEEFGLYWLPIYGHSWDFSQNIFCVFFFHKPTWIPFKLSIRVKLSTYDQNTWNQVLIKPEKNKNWLEVNHTKWFNKKWPRHQASMRDK